MHLSYLPKLFPLLRPVLHWSEGHRYFAAAISWYDTCHGCGILLSPGVGLQVFKGRVGPTLWLLCDHLRGQGIASNVWWRSFQMSFLGNPANLQRLASPCSCLGISLETKRYATRPVERKIKMYTGGCQKNAGAKLFRLPTQSASVNNAVSTFLLEPRYTMYESNVQHKSTRV